jgi:phospholipid/cholesterol/gamma-HCH transport system substrate-binding protein
MSTRTAPRRTAATRTAAVLTAAALLTGCGFEGASSIPLPGGQGTGDDAYEVTIEFSDVLDLVPQSAVKVDDVTVGSVTSIDLDGYTARVVASINGDVELPANTSASLRQTSLLGEKFVSFDRPPPEQANGRLRGGEVIGLDRTQRSAEIEEVLSALSLLLNGGSIEQLNVISTELVNVLEGRETDIKGLLQELDTFVGGLDDQKDQIVRALDSLDRLSARLVTDRQTLATALEDIPAGVQVLTEQREQITRVLTSLDELGDVAVGVIQASQTNTRASLEALRPILNQLNAAGEDFPNSLELLTTYPFPRTIGAGIKGDFANLFVTLDVDLEQVLLAETGAEVPLEDGLGPVLDLLPQQAPAQQPPAQAPALAARAAPAAAPVAARGPARLRRAGAGRRPDRAVQRPALAHLEQRRAARPARGRHPMITRQTWTQLAVFLVISVLGVTYTGLRYAGLDRFFVDTGYLVSADFVDSGGIFEAAEVTYRGVPVGAVEEMTLIDDGVRVTMRLRPGVEVPDDARALVANRSAIGEQYVDLEPQRQGGPFMDEGFVIPQERTAIPISPTELIVNLDDFVSSVDTDDLGIVLDELGQAFDGTGESLQALVDSGNVLTQAALDDIEPTRRLIRDGETALDTQRDTAGQFRSFNRDLALLTETLRTSDPDFRRLYANGTRSADEITALIESNRAALPVLFDNLITFAQIQNVRLPALRQILVTYPNVVAGGYTVVPGDGTSHFGLVTNQDPPVCVRGYESTPRRDPADTSIKPNVNAFCAEESPNEVNVRGSRNVPRPNGLPPFPEDRQRGQVQERTSAGAPDRSFDEGALADYDPISGRVTTLDGQRFTLGSTAGASDRFGSDSWRWMLLNPLSK